MRQRASAIELGYAYAAAGERDRALALLQEIQARTDGDADAAAAHVYLALGDTAQALAGLERAAAKHAAFFSAESMAAPIFDPIRGSARFAHVLQVTGLDGVLSSRAPR